MRKMKNEFVNFHLDLDRLALSCNVADFE